jgi:hypothetical protein
MPVLFNPKIGQTDIGLGTGPGTLFSPFIDARDFDAASRAIFELANWVEDVEEPLQGAKEIARADMERRFIKQEDPFGIKWEDLTPATEIEKFKDVGFILPILTRTSALRDAATDEAAWFVRGDSVMFDTSGLPKYWKYHQQKGGRGAIKRLVRPKNSRMENIETTNTAPYTDETHNMHQRAFIGLSEMAEEEIEAYISSWLEAGLETAVVEFKGYQSPVFGIGSIYRGGTISRPAPGSHGRLQYRVSGAGFGGRFGPML